MLLQHRLTVKINDFGRTGVNIHAIYPSYILPSDIFEMGKINYGEKLEISPGLK